MPNRIVRCADCEAELPPVSQSAVNVDYRNTDSQRICDECNENYFRCPECWQTHSNEDGTSWNDSLYCDNCLDGLTVICDRCDERENRYDAHRVTDNRYDVICDDCYSNYFFTCDSCGNAFNNSRYGQEGMCATCYANYEDDSDDSSSEDDNPCIHSYSYKPRCNFHRHTSENGAHKDYLGVELEVNSNQIIGHARYTLQALNGSDTEEHAFLKQDGSITSGGFEIVTHPHTLKSHRELWQSFFSAVPQGMTSYKTGQCGMHVHISRSGLTDMVIRRMLVFLNAPQNGAYITAIAQRSSNSYARRQEKTLTEPFSYDRYEALNLTNRCTAELRIFRGTVRKDRFFKNLEFAMAMVQFCRESNYSQLDSRTFVSWVSKRKHSYKYLYNYHVERGYSFGKQLATEDRRKSAVIAVVDDTAA